MKRLIQITDSTVAKISNIIEKEKKQVFAIPSDPKLWYNCSLVDVSRLSIASLADRIANDDLIFFSIDAEEENEQKS